MGTLVFHTAFSHNLAGIRVIGIMAGLNAVEADLIKEIIHHRFQGLRHEIGRAHV